MNGETTPAPAAVPATAPAAEAPPRWRPLGSRQRRVVGVLVEKAKTTPDGYPMTINALTNGCNQKSNRWPLMNLSQEEIEQALQELREAGAVVEIQGGGRVPKYRHQMYEWLGVDKVELAVMAELLLRGEQTVGELRARASRMEPIADLNQLRPVLQSLSNKKLVVLLTPEGRGQMVTHGLYPEQELEELKARVAAQPARSAAADGAAEGDSARPRGASAWQAEIEAVRAEVTALAAEVQRLRELIEKPQP